MQEGGNQSFKISGKERESLWKFCKDHLSYWGFGDGDLEVGLEMTERCSSMTPSLSMLKSPKPKDVHQGVGEESVAGGQEEGRSGQ